MNQSAANSGSVVLAGGGTAGHTSPLIATGLELLRLSPGLALTALGTARGLETTVVPAAGLEQRHQVVTGFDGLSAHRVVLLRVAHEVFHRCYVPQTLLDEDLRLLP